MPVVTGLRSCAAALRQRRLAAFLAERQASHVRMRRGERPWTADPVIEAYSIDPVYREQDDLHSWEIAEMARLGSDRERVTLAISLNDVVWVRCYRELAASRSLDDFRRRTAGWTRGEVYNCVVQNRPRFGLDYREMAWRNYCLARGAAGDALARLVGRGGTFREAMRLLRRSGLVSGRYRHYNAVTSLSYFVPHLGEDDEFEPGPGTVEVFREVSGGAAPTRAEAGAVRDEVVALLPRGFAFSGFLPEKYGPRKFTLRNLEDCLCQWRKYENGREGRGKLRRDRGWF